MEDVKNLIVQIELQPGVRFMMGNEHTWWRVLDVDEEAMTALIISDKTICQKAYHDEYESITWEKCSLRRWLNGEYFEQNFSDEEKASILESDLENKNNPEEGTPGGNPTKDKVFLLSIDEINRYFKDDVDREADCFWWLRSLGCDSDYAAGVNSGGSVDCCGIYVDTAGAGVRPAFRINLKSEPFKSRITESETAILISLPQLNIQNSVLISAASDAEYIVIPDGVTELGEKCFSGMKNLKTLSLPSSLQIIGAGALDGCSSLKNLHIPSSVTTIGGQKEYYGSITYTPDYTLPDKRFSQPDFMQLLERNMAANLTAEEWASLYLFHLSKPLKRVIKGKYTGTIDEMAAGMLAALEKAGTDDSFMRMAAYVFANGNAVTAETIKKLYTLAADRALSAADILAPLAGVRPAAEEGDPYALWRSIYNEQLLDDSLKIKSSKSRGKLYSQVRLADSEEYAPAFIVKCAVAPYLDLFTERPHYGDDYKTEYYPVKRIRAADMAASLLNPEDLRALVTEEYKNGSMKWEIPYGRYADGEQAASLISFVSRNVYGSGEKKENILIRGALMLNETRETIIYMEKNGFLDAYAKLNGKDIDSLMNAAMTGLCRKKYDLGSKIIEVSVGTDLKPELYDIEREKIVKSIPKKGTDPNLVKEAEADLTKLKKAVKEAVEFQNHILLADFLSGRTRSVESWTDTCSEERPISKRTAGLVVWNQGKNTFTMTETGAVDCHGNAYRIDPKMEIGVAHPLEMGNMETEAWQKYFLSNGLKQPFKQIWEPVIDAAAIRADRYSKCMIPYSCFQKQDRQGITLDAQGDIHFADCDVKAQREVEMVDIEGRGLNFLEYVRILSFKFSSYTRQTNHIASYLDIITVKSRIRNDDVTIAEVLDEFTFAQIMEFINLAIEKKSNDCLALLMDYKNKNIPDRDPIEEFTLE